jgi:hypothetical protein
MRHPSNRHNNNPRLRSITTAKVSLSSTEISLTNPEDRETPLQGNEEDRTNKYRSKVTAGLSNEVL